MNYIEQENNQNHSASVTDKKFDTYELKLLYSEKDIVKITNYVETEANK